MEHKPFSGFEVIEQLPTGDQRRVFEVGVTETDESLTRNEFIVWVECKCAAFTHQNFKRGTEPEEINAWVNAILEAHKNDCSLEIMGE